MRMSALLPDARTLVTNLLNAISGSLPNQESSNPLTNPTPNIKNLILTLHVLFPTELLPAMDLLDRNLVTRLLYRNEQAGNSALDQHHEERHAGPEGRIINAGPDDLEPATVTSAYSQSATPPVYIIRSAQQASTSYSRFRDATALQYYEVRTRAWNCSCPAFAFSAFPAAMDGNEEDLDERQQPEGQEYGHGILESDAGQTDVLQGHVEDKVMTTAPTRDWKFAGVSLGKNLPVCKHLLACVLVEQITAFTNFATVEYISDEEMAGWLAG